MDDDLRTLATLLAAPEPSDAAIGCGRAQLVGAIGSPGGRRRGAARGRGSRRRAGWLAGGLGVVAAATAAAVVLSSGSTPVVPRGNPPVIGGASAARLEGQRILLAAAVSAAAQPSGTYWHFTVKTTMAGASETDQEWVAHDMRYWSAQAACGTTPAGVVAQGPGYGGFYYSAGDLLTYQQTEHLPSQPSGPRRMVCQVHPACLDHGLLDRRVPDRLGVAGPDATAGPGGRLPGARRTSDRHRPRPRSWWPGAAD